MSHCCTSNEKNENKVVKTLPKKQACPVNEKDYVLVPLKTVLHHIINSWSANLPEQGYYFCNDPECDVVYFGEDGLVIKMTKLRSIVSVKRNEVDDPVCYCFGIKKSDAIKDHDIKQFVIAQTKIGNCSCETSNPSGRCCLKDFP